MPRRRDLPGAKPWPFPAARITAGGFAKRQTRGAACLRCDPESLPPIKFAAALTVLAPYFEKIAASVLSRSSPSSPGSPLPFRPTDTIAPFGSTSMIVGHATIWKRFS
jgi:hypothetical protein